MKKMIQTFFYYSDPGKWLYVDYKILAVKETHCSTLSDNLSNSQLQKYFSLILACNCPHSTVQFQKTLLRYTGIKEKKTKTVLCHIVFHFYRKYLTYITLHPYMTVSKSCAKDFLFQWKIVILLETGSNI